METIKNKISLRLTIACFTGILSWGNASAQILHVDSVSVDSVWNSDSSWYDGNGILQQRTSRDCHISFIPQGEGMAQMFIAMSIDSGKTWTPSPNPLTVLNNGLSSTFKTGQKATIMIRVFGGDRPGVAFKMTARQNAPIISGNPKTELLGVMPAPTPGSNVDALLSLSLASENAAYGFCTIAKIYWDALGDETVDDSTTGPNALTWTWLTQVPAGASGQKQAVIARAIDKNGLSSVPETLNVQFGLQRPIVMKNIQAGTFTMGSNNTLDLGASPPHQVTLSAYTLQETDVTQEQYFAVIGVNPSQFNSGTDALLRPVEKVTWYNAVLYCNALSKLGGLDTCYTYTQAGATDAACDFTKHGYRLPTEAEWEYACRAGSITGYYWGDTINGNYCWYDSNSSGSTHAVATKQPNAWGLFDMSGNVFQWCNDWYGSYGSASQTDPIGANGTSGDRVLRGGSWYNIGNGVPHISYLRSAYRDSPDGNPARGYNFFGFRCVRR
jgi:formylglycine-generating enzyme required for sulfatase activity